MDSRPGPSNWQNHSHNPPLSNTQSTQQSNINNYQSWEPQQQQHWQEQPQQQQQYWQEQQTQQQHQSGFHSGYSTHASPPSIDVLQEEISKRKRQLELLENRATEAENKYTAYVTVEETEPQRQLREYKQFAERKYSGYDKEVRSLHHLATSQEQQLGDLTAEMETVVAELIKTKTDLANEASQETPDTEWMHKIQEYKTMYIAQRGEEIELQRRIDELEKSFKEQSNTTPSGADLISSLESGLNFTADMTGLTITNYETKDGVSKCTCDQVGRLGSIQYRLEFFTDSDGTRQVYYTPLDVGFLDQQLVASMKEELQFAYEDTGVFFWRMMTVLNKRKSDRR